MLFYPRLFWFVALKIAVILVRPHIETNSERFWVIKMGGFGNKKNGRRMS
jgi:hypothetical protein